MPWDCLGIFFGNGTSRKRRTVIRQPRCDGEWSTPMPPVKEGLAHFTIDAGASLFTVQAFASGMVAVIAHSPKFAIRDMAGEIEFVPGTMQKALVNMTINVGSLEIMDEVDNSERREIERVMFDEVLERRHYPKVEYRSVNVSALKTGENMYRINVLGDLALHGITRGVSLDAQVMAGEDTLRAQGSFSIVQSDFGLQIASVAGGTLKLKDELKFSYFILARRAK
jgi:polyisoprenoid-binding protein YceI